MKLSEAQRSFLAQVNMGLSNSCASRYRPAQKLRDLGLIEVEERRYGGWLVTITPAGIKALEG